MRTHAHPRAMAACLQPPPAARVRAHATLEDTPVPARPQLPSVSVIVPVHNAAATLDAALASVCAQTYTGRIQVVAYDDASTDASAHVLARWCEAWEGHPRISLVLAHDLAGARASDTPRRAHGPAFARNRAVEASDGEYLCLLDADDEALPHRIERQLCVCGRGTLR